MLAPAVVAERSEVAWPFIFLGLQVHKGSVCKTVGNRPLVRRATAGNLTVDIDELGWCKRWQLEAVRGRKAPAPVMFASGRRARPGGG
jgi:hypothetical protein